MIYFFFSFSHDRKIIGSTAKVGRWLLMICFGAFFGNTIMTRMAVFLERLQFLINDWCVKAIPTTPLIYYAYGIGILIAIIAIYLLTRRPPTKPPVPETIEGEPVPEIPAGQEY
jgi:hypothetical protein